MNKSQYQNQNFTIRSNNSIMNGSNNIYFPSLTHKELHSIHDLKLKTNYDIKNMKQNNFHKNFHIEVMKTSLKENSKFFSIYKDTAAYSKTEAKFPKSINGRNEKIFKLYMDPKTISSIINRTVNKNIKINYKSIFNNNSKKYNTSNISTSGNISPSMKSVKFSALDKLKSNSVDFNRSLFNQEKDENSLMKTLKSNTSSFSNILPFNITDTKNNYSIEIKNDFNKKFLSSINPLYSTLKNELLSEFYKKTKEINYLKFIIMKNKKDIEIHEERMESKIERMDQILYIVKTLKNLFTKFSNSKIEYLNYLQKTISNETEINKVLKEEKINLMNEIYMIRHKTLRLENRFKNYLDDKFFLLSVKNHSFNLEKFEKEDRDDYKNDLKKLEVLYFMLKITSKEYNKEEFESPRRTRKFTRHDLLNLGSSKYISNKLKKPNTKNKGLSLTSSPRIFESKKRILSRINEAKPIYEEVYYFNKDLEETTKKIQDSLNEYNNVSKELNLVQQNLIKTKSEMKNIKDYENYLKDEIILYKKDLENLKKLNIGLQNYQIYLQNIYILNLNKGKVYSEISNIYKNIEESKDEKLLDYLAPSNEISGLDKLKSIEKVLEFLISFKEIQKNNNNKKYYIIQKQIDDNNRQKLNRKKQEDLINKFNMLRQKVIDKNNKLIFLPRKKVINGIKISLNNNKKNKNEKKGNDYFDSLYF